MPHGTEKEIMKPLGIKAKVALVTSLTSIAMIALVTMIQVQHMRADFTRVLLSQQSALITRTAAELHALTELEQKEMSASWLG